MRAASARSPRRQSMTVPIAPATSTGERTSSPRWLSRRSTAKCGCGGAGGTDPDEAARRLDQERESEKAAPGRRHGREQQRGERQHECCEAERDRDGRAETRLDPLDRTPHQQEQAERGEDDGPEADL